MNQIIAFLFFIMSLGHAQTFQGRKLQQKLIPGELLVICKSNCIKNIRKGFKARSRSRVKTFFKGKNKYSMIKVKGVSNQEYQNFKNFADSDPGMIIGPNYHYIGDPREAITSSSLAIEQDDPELEKQDHHEIIQTFNAWKNKSFGKAEIIVAVTDDGVSLKHKDLKDAIWFNKKEIPNNGKDDDENGFIDDVNGWDFSDGDNNPDGGSHGTHVAGIIGATINNGIGGAGIAPGVKIMPIRWYGGSKRWTSEMIAESYLYALNNGAQIINTSYNIDGFVNDKIYRDVVKLLKKEGMLVFNSAGNGGKKDPPRAEIEEVVLVAALDSDFEKNKVDTKAYFSNYGEGIDISAPGHPIYSTVLRGGYGDMSGTSMASPAAAGVAALIWSQNPELTNTEVLAKLLKGADNVSAKNPKMKGLLGTGRINVPNSLKSKAKVLEISLFSKKIKKNKSGDFQMKFSLTDIINKSVLESMAYVYITKPAIDAPQTYSRLKVKATYDKKNDYVALNFNKKLEDGNYIIKVPKKYFKYERGDQKRFPDSAKSTKVYEYYVITIQ